MSKSIVVNKNSSGRYFRVNGEKRTLISTTNLAKEINSGKIVKVYGKVPTQVWRKTGTSKRPSFNTVNKTESEHYNLAGAPVEEKRLFSQVKKIWDVTTDTPLQKWIGEQSEKIGASPRVIMESVIKHSEVLNKNSLVTAFARLRRNEALYTANPTGNLSPNERVNSYLRNVALDELMRKFTPALRQAHSGSLFEQAAIAVAAKAAGKTVLSFPAIGTNFSPNINTRANYQGNRIQQIWKNDRYRNLLSNGIFVLKSAFGLARIKNNETNEGLKKLFFKLVTANSINKNQKNYSTNNKGKPRKLSTLMGKNVNTSLWKGFYEVQPDVLYFVLKGGKLLVYIYEFKIGSGKAEQEPAEYFQLVKAKRTLELIFEKYPPGIPYEISIHFFPLKYRLVNKANTNFKHPRNTTKWAANYRKLKTYGEHGSYALEKVTEPSDFKEQTGVDIQVLKSVLNAYSAAEQEEIARSLRGDKRKGAHISSNVEATKTARIAYNKNNAVSRALNLAALGGTQGRNYIASLMANGIKTDVELIAALNYLEIAGYRLQKKGNASGNKLSIVRTLRIRPRGPANSYGSTWSGAKKVNKRTIAKILARVNAAKAVPENQRNFVTETILNKLNNYDIVPPPPLFESNIAQNARVAMANNAERVAYAPESNFEQMYGNFVRTHISPNYGVSKNNARSAVENALNRLSAMYRGRGNTNSANYYASRKNTIPNI